MILLIACLALLGTSGGCAYHQAGEHGSDGYHWSSLYRQDIHTVAVPIFTSRDFHRGVEFQLSEALVKKIEAFTPYKVVDSAHADTILEGEIVSVHPLTISLNPATATPQEQQYTIVVNFAWKEVRSGKILVERRNFEETTVYYPTLGESQYVGSQSASERLALSIVHEMEAGW